VTRRTWSGKECNVDRISAKSEFRAKNVVLVLVVMWLILLLKTPS